MKKTFKRGLSVFLAVLLLLCAGPLEGFVGMQFPAFPKLDLGSIFANVAKATNVDYSDLSENQYMAKVLLNSNYQGSALTGDSMQTTIPKTQLDLYRIPEKVSNVRSLVEELKRNDGFMAALADWEFLNFKPSDIVDDPLKEKDYYATVIMSVLDAEMKDSVLLNNLNNEYSSFALKMSNTILGVCKTFTDINIADDKAAFKNFWDTMTTDQLQTLYYQLANDRELQTFYECSGKGVGFVTDTLSLCTSAYDMAKTCASFITLGRMGEEVEAVLDELYLQCPSSNQAMKAALLEVSAACNDALQASVVSVVDTTANIASFIFSEVANNVWNACLEGIAGGFVGGALIGQAIGKSISNFMFSTDAIKEQFYAMRALVEFEDVMLSTLTSLGNKFKADESDANADAFMQAVKMLFSTYTLGYDYVNDFIDVGYHEGLYHTIHSLTYEQEQSIQDYKNTLMYMKTMVNEMKETLTDLDGYRWWYEVDAPTAYQAAFVKSPANVITTTSPHDNTYIPITYTPVANNPAWLKYERNSDGYITITSCFIGATGTIEIPEGIEGKRVTEISDYAFQNCIGITEVICPRFLKSIGYYAFYGCTSLTNVTLNEGLTDMGWQAFGKTGITSVVIPKTVTWMYSPFNEADKLKTVVFADGMEKIPESALYDCSSVTSVTFPSSLTEINNYAFYGCSGIPEIELPNLLNLIGEYAFAQCTGISEVVFPSSTRTIDYYAFYKCTNLKKVTLNEGLTDMGWQAFGKTGITSVVIPKTVTWMYSPFNEADKLKTVVFADGMEKIPESALYDCSSVTNALLPSSIVEICDYAFSGCSSITDITIHEAVETIDDYAFDDCDSLTTFHVVRNSVAHEFAVENGYRVAFIDCSHAKTEVGQDKPATCTTDGLQTIVCAFCKETIRSETTDALGHDWMVITLIVTPTCSAKGSAKVVCSRCGELTETEVDQLPHNYIITSETQATCKELGQKVFTCSVCGNSYTETIDKIPHNYELTSETAATCTQNGAKVYTCTGCGDSYSEATEAIGHNYVLKETIESTCTEQGYEYYECTHDSSHHYKTMLDLKEHTIVIDKGTKGTCMEPGLSDGSHCSVCGLVIEEQVYLPAGEHDFETTTVAATCTKFGYVTKVCKLCGYKDFEWPLEKLGHDWVTDPAVDSTCTESGLTKGIHCTRCNYVLVEQYTTILADHIWSDSYPKVCTVCGCDYYSSGGKQSYPTTYSFGDFKYTLSSNKATIVKYLGSETTLTIPASVDSYTVNGVDFSSCTTSNDSVTSIIICEGVQSVGNDFKCFPNLQQIQFPSTVTSIKNNNNGFLFENNSIQKISVNSANNKFKSDKYGALYNTSSSQTSFVRYPSGSEATRYSIPDEMNVVYIEPYAFCKSDYLNEVLLPNSLKQIKKYAFYGSGISSISLPNKVQTLNESAFENCVWLRTVNFGSVKTIEKNAFKKSGITSVQLPDNVTTLGRNAFESCSSLVSVTLGSKLKEIQSETFKNCNNNQFTSISIPESVVKVQYRAFEGCSYLKTIEIPYSTIYVGTDAFKDCGRITDVYYGGTQAEWNNIVFESGNETLQNANIHFVDRDCNHEEVTLTRTATKTLEGCTLTVCLKCEKELANEVIPFVQPNDHTPGDINGDGVLNNKDLNRLMKYLAGEEVEVVEAALDLNGDGKVNNKDLNRLMKYLAGEDVEVF